MGSDSSNPNAADPKWGPSLSSLYLVRGSIARLPSRQGQLTDCFRAQLVALLPRSRAFLRQQPPEEFAELVETLLHLIASIPDPSTAAQLRVLGARLQAWGLPVEDYPVAARAFVRSVQETSETAWSTQLSSAWVEVHSWAVQQLVANPTRPQAIPPERLSAKVDVNMPPEDHPPSHPRARVPRQFTGRPPAGHVEPLERASTASEGSAPLAGTMIRASRHMRALGRFSTRTRLVVGLCVLWMIGMIGVIGTSGRSEPSLRLSGDGADQYVAIPEAAPPAVSPTADLPTAASDVPAVAASGSAGPAQAGATPPSTALTSPASGRSPVVQAGRSPAHAGTASAVVRTTPAVVVPSPTNATASATTAPTTTSSSTVTRSAASGTTTTAVPTTPASAGISNATRCRVSYRFDSYWNDGFTVSMDFTNTSTTPLSGWSGSFGMSPSATVVSSWGGTLTGSGSLRITPADYNVSVPAGGKVTIGFQAATKAPATNLGPFSVNGTMCAVG